MVTPPRVARGEGCLNGAQERNESNESTRLGGTGRGSNKDKPDLQMDALLEKKA